MATSSDSGKRTFHSTLKRKLILSMLLVGILPLLIGLVMAFLQARKEIREVNGASFQALAVETGRKLDLVIKEEEAKTRRITLNPEIIRILEERRDELVNGDETTFKDQLDHEQETWIKKDPKFLHPITQGPLAKILEGHYRGTISEKDLSFTVVTRSATRALYITDIMGRLVASINTKVPFTNKEASWWKGAFNKGIGQTYLENVAFDNLLETYTFSLSIPIMDSIGYQTIGVLHRVYDAKEFFAPSIDIIGFGKTGHVMLIDSQGIVLSCPVLPTGKRIEDARVIPLVIPRHPGWAPTPSDGHGGSDTSIIGFTPLPSVSRITQQSTGTAWHMFVWQSSEELYGPIQNLFTWIAVFGAISFGLLITLGSIAAGRIVTPIRRLQAAAKLIGKGELREPIVIKTGDEIEELADEVNRMNQQLESAFKQLKSHLASKTEEVQYLQESTTQILDSVPDPVIMLDIEEHIQYMNRASKDAFGLGNGTAEGNNLFEVLKTKGNMRQKLQQEIQDIGQVKAESLSGRSTQEQQGASPLRDPLSPELSMAQNEDHRTLDINNRIYRYEWFPVKARPGENQRIGLVLRDTTEETRLHERLSQNEKLASLGVLTAGIGHELNNPLVGVIGFGEAILEENDTAQMKEYAKSIVERGKRMAAIIQDFTGQVRRQSYGRLSQVNLNDQLTQALKLVQLTEDIPSLDIQTDYQPIPPIQGQPDDIRQAFVNLIKNAVQAMKGGDSLFLGTQCLEGLVTITIRDSGKGIPKPFLNKIFDPFFTTKRQGEGAGLGLTIVRKTVTKYGGEIRIESTEGQGTTCLMTFPTSYPPPSKEESP